MDMRQRVRNLESDDSVVGSSNFGKFIKLFESDNSRWIEEINDNVVSEDSIMDERSPYEGRGLI